MPTPEPIIYAWTVTARLLVPDDGEKKCNAVVLDMPGFRYQNGTLIAPQLSLSPDNAIARQMAIERLSADGTAAILEIELSDRRAATWHLGWFDHQTLRNGRTNAELERSFARFVAAATRGDRDEIYGPDGKILMGAEDRYRWKFCECAKCAAGPRVSIGH